jgi:hypothetical protein
MIPPKPVTGQKVPVGYDRMIWEWIKSMQLSSPSRYLSVGRGAGGQTVDLNIQRVLDDIATANNQGGGDTYNGYFKVILDGSNYSVVDGSNASATNCGYVVVGNTRIAVPKVTDISASGNGAFYIQTTYSGGYSVSIEFASSLPTSSNGTDIKLIADLNEDIPIQRIYGEHVITRWV